MIKYTTKGSARSTCGHNHRSIKTAVKCLLADGSGCQSQGGYTDRFVVRVDGVSLTDNERDYILTLRAND